MTQSDDRSILRVINNIISSFRDIDAEMSVNQVTCLTWVFLNEGKTQVDMRRSLMMPSSTASRCLAALSKVHRLGKPGLNLIEWVENPEDRRAKLIFLTPKGKLLRDKMISQIG